MALLRYRYYQPADGRHHYPGALSSPSPAFRLVYAGSIPAHSDETTQDVLARLVGRHGMAGRPEGADFRPLGTGDLLDLGERGIWQILPVGFQVLPPETVLLDRAA